MKIRNIFIMLFLVLSHTIYSQFDVYNEVGGFIGATQLQTDYGKNTEFNLGTASFGGGLILYTSIDDHDISYRPVLNFIKKHVKLRTELSYSNFEHNHQGQYTLKNSLGSNQLKAMHGTTGLTNLTFQLECYMIDVVEFENEREPFRFNPFVSFGAGVSYYNTKTYSDLGPIGLESTTFAKFLYPSEGRPYGFSSENKFTGSIVTNLGTRFNVSRGHDLFMDVRFQYFFSDWVDGLNPNKELFKENSTNDTFVSLNLGWIIYLE